MPFQRGNFVRSIVTPVLYTEIDPPTDTHKTPRSMEMGHIVEETTGPPISSRFKRHGKLGEHTRPTGDNEAQATGIGTRKKGWEGDSAGERNQEGIRHQGKGWG